MTEKLLEVRNLRKHFPTGGGWLRKAAGHIRAVDGVSFSIDRGETFALVGESGCGKTTVGKLVLRLIEATEGDIRFEGVDVRGLNAGSLRALRRRMQIVFQDPYGSLNPRMNVGDIIGEPIRWHRLCAEADVEERVFRLLDKVGLSRKEVRKYPHEFSGGQRQRIVIARALAVSPQMVVCDEPVSALDVSIQAQILNLLKDLQAELGMAYLFIAHGMPAVRYMADRVGVMYLGRLVEVAPGEALFERPLHPYTEALLSSVPQVDPDHAPSRAMVKGDVPSLTEPISGCGFCSRCPAADARCKAEAPELRQARDGHYVACHFAGASAARYMEE